ncbi:MAG TPA: hypothetical protein VM012_12215 [Flavitalea sp.]|nr:hypothetical protein [Flavitalea sp.]
MKPLLIYCYDAYCGWCYGFSPVMKTLAIDFRSICQFEVLSGGMILPDKPVHISVTAEYIARAYPTVEISTGVKFGEDYLWHIRNPAESDWFPNSEKPAIALCVLKEIFPDRQVEIASGLQYALHFEGRDLTDDEAYRQLIKDFEVDEFEFYQKLRSEEYKAKAYEEFELVKRFQVNGYPTLMMQADETKFYLITRGYTNYEATRDVIDKVLITLTSKYR